MCGRYTLTSKGDELALLFDLRELPLLPPRYNMAPTQEAAVVRVLEPGGERRLDPLKWGLIPYWCEDPKGGRKPINAKSETVARLPTF